MMMKSMVTASLVAASLVLASVSAGARGVIAEYTVPTDASLAPFARFPIQADLEVRGSQVSVEYKLPRELTGKTQSVFLTGLRRADGRIDLNGPHGTADCRNGECQIRYMNVEIDRDARDQRIREISASPAEFSARVAVAEKFREDPFGIIRFGGMRMKSGLTDD